MFLKRQYSSNDCVHVCLFIRLSMTMSLTPYPISDFATFCPSNICLWEPDISFSRTCKKTSELFSLINHCSLIDFYFSQSHISGLHFCSNFNHVFDVNYTCNIMCLVEANLTFFCTCDTFLCVCKRV